MADGVVVLVTSELLPAGLLSAAAWERLRSSRVFVGAAGHPLLPSLHDTGVEGTVVAGPPADVAATVRGAAPATWVSAAGDEGVVQELARAGAVTLVGSADPPGAQLLAAVRVMDRLRSTGGCPWDAEQTHASLAKYLIEEAYETVELIEAGENAALVEEIGDVLLQVLFHARIAAERADGWDVDDVAAGLVDKLVRRHPHVFGDATVGGASDVIANWDVLKAKEKGRTSVTEGVPLGQPALAFVEKLLARSRRAGLPAALADEALRDGDPVAALRGLLTEPPAGLRTDADDAATDEVAVAYVGRVLTLAVALARSLGVNPETALRGAARGYRDRILAAERSAGTPSG